MPKLKTNSGAKKRLKKTSSGKIRHKKANLRHMLTSKGTKRKRHLRAGAFVSPADQKSVSRLIPYA
ncbi:MAG: 50S ribosomal protein L35 [Deltaproteobacteria bacterium RIFCSPLOWO2_02_FULL_50_16]|nr:MAG: 50S ribosomal protein L35 [Deltaproteobacteria bacterium GWA2_50_8]OGQ25719.1 MAG: 50S ribosomal protein L35 [Deltaproteobacteria bacterium RIFCSPHIGHO2_02_FULL_50_15]OGQ56982.1 MAG: 50S ribosomal protein L35 [Deltaproteobacteria bacterium RIFCSPLOWO2_02_FULL_50_16]OGQ68060.1 MAG: 50S ribosomal protein L35 [Deltaproteobacteria bacterium RIFCSPLOWO2_12_FULL_50_11]